MVKRKTVYYVYAWERGRWRYISGSYSLKGAKEDYKHALGFKFKKLKIVKKTRRHKKIIKKNY